MKQYISALDSLVNNTLKIKSSFEEHFATSVDVVIKASGLRLETIRDIARRQGVEIEDTTCRCVKEGILDTLADTHVQKMKAYFNNAQREIAKLNCDEFTSFIDFCRTFKKNQSSDSLVRSWKDIDADAIRNQFLQRVHELTPLLFQGSTLKSVALVEEAISSICIEPCDILETFEFKQRCDVVDRILHSHLYYEKPAKTHHVCIDIRSVFKRVSLPARYHLFTSEDDDHQQDTIDMFSINRAPAMVA